MAGGKETPRQKMIGMMYMVLTALLALNVSSAVLEKFAILNETLTQLVKDNSTDNERLLTSIQSSSVKSTEVDEAKDKANKVRTLTKKTLAFMDDIKKQMTIDKSGEPIKAEDLPQNTNRAEELMLDESKGKGTSLAIVYEKTLNKHVAELNEIMKPKVPFKLVTKTAGDYAMFQNAKEELKKQPYEAFAFHGTPTMGAIAYVTQMETEILEYEKVALGELLAVTKGKVYEVDQLVPMVRAQSNSLVAGATYEGDLFVAGAASGVDPVMFKGNEPVKVEEVEVSPGVKIKMGKIKFKAGATNYDKSGIAKMSYSVKINIPNREPILQNIEYNVIRPKATFASVASSTLYLECGNEKDVSIQGLTEVSGLNLSCSADEGKIVKTGSGKFVLIPRRPQMNVNITMDGVSIGVEKFGAQPVPEPQFIIKNQGQEVNLEKGVPANARLNVDIRIPDNVFVTQNRADAGYRITRMVLLTSNGPRTLNNSAINLSELGARSGEKLLISAITVVRSTYDPNEPDDKPVNFKFSGVPINVAR